MERSCEGPGRLRPTVGVLDDIDEQVIGHTLAAWQIEHVERAALPSDTRVLDVLLTAIEA
jgi:hypothetical protein